MNKETNEKANFMQVIGEHKCCEHCKGDVHEPHTTGCPPEKGKEWEERLEEFGAVHDTRCEININEEICDCGTMRQLKSFIRTQIAQAEERGKDEYILSEKHKDILHHQYKKGRDDERYTLNEMVMKLEEARANEREKVLEEVREWANKHHDTKTGHIFCLLASLEDKKN